MTEFLGVDVEWWAIIIPSTISLLVSSAAGLYSIRRSQRRIEFLMEEKRAEIAVGDYMSDRSSFLEAIDKIWKNINKEMKDEDANRAASLVIEVYSLALDVIRRHENVVPSKVKKAASAVEAAKDAYTSYALTKGAGGEADKKFQNFVGELEKLCAAIRAGDK